MSSAVMIVFWLLIFVFLMMKDKKTKDRRKAAQADTAHEAEGAAEPKDEPQAQADYFGEGVPPDLRPTLFDGGLHRARQDAADDRRSMGIGLSVCRTIVRAHGGEMRAEASAHGGAAFIFYLPCMEEDDVQYDPKQDIDHRG